MEINFQGNTSQQVSNSRFFLDMRMFLSLISKIIYTIILRSYLKQFIYFYKLTVLSNNSLITYFPWTSILTSKRLYIHLRRTCTIVLMDTK